MKEFFVELFKLIKVRADLVVALTAVLGLALGYESLPPVIALISIFAGGFLVTATAHILNQIIERKYDRLMSRTASRPLASGRWSISTALLLAFIFSFTGLIILYLGVGRLAALISLTSLILYVFLYTPLKRKSRWSIPIGAIPGALPVLIGYVGATGRMDSFALLIFFFQIIWQFPHFWSIAWLWHDEYQNGGYDLLPTSGGRTRKNAWLIFLSVFVLLPFIHFMYKINSVGFEAYTLMLILSTWFVYEGWKFLKNSSLDRAQKLMFASILYLPLILILILIDKIALL